MHCKIIKFDTKNMSQIR